MIQARPRKTVDDYMRLPEGAHAELIGGELLMNPTPRTPHERAVLNLFRALDPFIDRRSLGEIFLAPFSVFLPSGDVVEPDIMFVSRSNAGIVQDWIRGAPDLLIEVVSPSGTERDRLIKRELYERNGVKEYWIVDPEAKTVEVLSLINERYEPRGYFQEGETLVSPLLAGFELPVQVIFAQISARES